MISTKGCIAEVLEVIHGLPLADVIEHVKAEKRAAEACCKREPPLSEACRRMYAYAQSLRCLLFWLFRKTKPRNCTAFPLFRPLTEALVRQGVFPPTALAAFGG